LSSNVLVGDLVSADTRQKALFVNKAKQNKIMNILTKILFHLCLIKHLFSGLHKWGIANDPATEDERFTETCFVERFGRRRQSQPKTSAPSVISVANKQLVKIRVNSWIFNTQYEIPNLALSEVEATQYEHPIIYVPIRHYIGRENSTNQPFLCKTNPKSSTLKST